MSAEAAAGWCNALRVYRRRPVITMLFLGFSAGLPFMLVFATLTAWLAEAGASRTAIGFFSWVGITYSIKVLWAPVIDRLPLPLLTSVLGKRRGWMLAGQLGIATGLLGLAAADPQSELGWIAGCALLVAFASASQDIAVDAFRIEAEARDYQGAMAATYQLGYRFAIIVSYAGALYIADATSWVVAYQTMAALTLVGMVTVLVSPEPVHATNPSALAQERRAVAFAERNAHRPAWLRRAGTWLIAAVLCPVLDFFARYGWLALGILALVGAFRITDIAMASMANPLYIDLGFSKSEIGTVSGIYGTALTVIGAFVGGSVVARYGILRPLLAAALLAAATNVLFAWIAAGGEADLTRLTVVIGAENLSGGFAMSVFIAWLSSLTNTAYTATQYALFSSLMTLPGKFLSGFGGLVVDAQGYPAFFLYTAALGMPAIALVAFLLWCGLSRGSSGMEAGSAKADSS